MNYYAIRDRKGDEMIGVFKYDEELVALPVVNRITEAEFDTYLEFGIKELDARHVITSLFDRLTTNRVAKGSTWC